MRYVRWYFSQLRALFAGPEFLDPDELGQHLLRRAVGRLMLAIPLLPLIVGGLLGWEAWKDWRWDVRNAAELVVSPCHLDDPTVLGLGSLEATGTVLGRSCDLEWQRDGRTVLSVEWDPDVRYGKPKGKVIERWDWDRPQTVEVVQDRYGNQLLVVAPVDGGRLELQPKADEVSEGRVVTAYLDR